MCSVFVLRLGQVFTPSLPRGLMVTLDMFSVYFLAEERSMSFRRAALADVDAVSWGNGSEFATLI